MPFDSVQFHASSLSFFKVVSASSSSSLAEMAVATRIELSSTPPQRHCFCLPYLQAPRPSHLLRRSPFFLVVSSFSVYPSLHLPLIYGLIVC
ncbi:hypothetical protein GBA52_020795 [Prunus armeniaca]|nr:hypothetical protein GBA52_020795 [Prunus armeniaca]